MPSIQPAPLLARDEVITMLRAGLSDTRHGLQSVPSALIIVIRDEGWRERILRETGQRAVFGSFAEFVTAAPLEGLGTSVEHLRDICRRDPEALDYIDHATQNPVGRPTGSGLNQSTSEDGKRDRTGQQIRRLRKDFPTLHAEVLAGGLTVHEASVQAGIFPKRVSINLTSARSAAETLRKAASHEFIAALRDALGEP